ncbi:periplasmic sensor signal transduction histidine kinase [Fulvivirga imtechensis AK7]|uniref:histidine kinase n=2 Tax=Fulvivirga TaxID=396811 RepID=L8JY81_9BACT|nr:periplasmic sensor signal transduction histidine kinase [Fulvivirga imtechensis AK7]
MTLHAANAQIRQVYQLKTFDQQLQPVKHLDIAINDNDYVSIGNKGVAFVELSDSDLPIKSIRLKDDKLEAASWNLSKGILEVIIRKKSYYEIDIFVGSNSGQPLKGVEVAFNGRKKVTGITDGNGKVRLPLALDEKIHSKEQFSLDNYNIVQLQTSELNARLIAEPAKTATVAPEREVRQQDTASSSSQSYFKDFDLSKLDSIQSLTVFYAIFKNYHIEDMDEPSRRKVDAKFQELIGQLKDSLNHNALRFFNNISDSTYLQEDISNLLAQSRLESRMLDEQQADFEEKIRLINDKLKSGFEALSEEERTGLLADIRLLERILSENESKFYKNHNSYRQVINDLMTRYFNLEDLEGKLSKSEAQRLEEQRMFRERLIAIFSLVVIFAVMIILLAYFSDKLKKQKKKLETANAEIKRINENLEGMVYQRTKMLEEANRELDTVLYRASHDLRSPVCSIEGLCNLAAILNEKERGELFEKVVQATKGMDKLLKKLSVISEINRPGAVSPVYLCEMIEVIRGRFKEVINSHEINFVIECSPDLIINTVPNLIEVILANLIENAIFFCVLKDSEEYQVVLKAMAVDTHVELSIFDNGIGVERTISDRLFDMFFRGNEHSKGNGLGLYIVQKSVQALGGRITVESEPGSFSKFAVNLPIHLLSKNSQELTDTVV